MPQENRVVELFNEKTGTSCTLVFSVSGKDRMLGGFGLYEQVGYTYTNSGRVSDNGLLKSWAKGEETIKTLTSVFGYKIVSDNFNGKAYWASIPVGR